MRMMSFALTERQLMDGSKTVTRRTGWANLRPGERLLAVRKAMGRPPTNSAPWSSPPRAPRRPMTGADLVTRIEFRVVPGSERARTQVGLGLAV